MPGGWLETAATSGYQRGDKKGLPAMQHGVQLNLSIQKSN